MNKLQRGLAWLVGKRKVLIVEVVDRPNFLKEDDESIRSLKTNPGFVMLMNRLKLQRSVVEAELIKGTHKDLRSVDRLQLGLFWLDFLQAQVNKAIAKNEETKAVTSTAYEQELFEQVYSQISGV